MHAPAVLVVDDELPILAFAERALTQKGYRVQTATTGEQALRMLETNHGFDMFVIDVMMPELSGPELAARIRRHHPLAKILYLTGFADQLFTHRPQLWEDEAFIEKPATLNGLREAVSLLL
jgi:two-component system cell cycle sensor histidine kinase/response regulator CckA